jgi:4'-phosphopantetheinyl transferase
MKAGTVIIHLIHPDAVSRRDADSFLTNEEKLRAASFRDPEHGLRWQNWRAALRRILGNEIGCAPQEVPLVLNEFGKPMLAGQGGLPDFSLSHCDDLALVALCVDGPVGVDVELLDRAAHLSGCEAIFCHPDEIAALPDEEQKARERLLETWTAKEALLKAAGTGFSHPPETIRLCAENGSWRGTSSISLAHFSGQIVTRLKHPSLADYCAMVSRPERVNEIRFA